MREAVEIRSGTPSCEALTHSIHQLYSKVSLSSRGFLYRFEITEQATLYCHDGLSCWILMLAGKAIERGTIKFDCCPKSRRNYLASFSASLEHFTNAFRTLNLL